MKEEEMDSRQERLPGEVVEIYQRRDYREVVETYVRPLPAGMIPQKPAPPKKRRKRTGVWIFLACFAVVVALAAASWIWRVYWDRMHQDRFNWRYEETDSEVSAEPTIPTWPIGQDARLTVSREQGDALTIQEIYRQVNPAVVTVMAELKEGISVGTGVIFSADGYILTNYHVVEGGSACTVVLDTGYSCEGLYVAGDSENDLAVLKVAGEDLPAAVFGDSDLLTVGDPVYAIGNPLGVELRNTLTDGIVSAINRDVKVDGRTMTLIQTNAALNSGNSGGPLINQYGQVVGINVIKMSSRYSNVEGLGFAIPSASMERIVNDLLVYGEVQPEPLLGVTVSQAGEELQVDGDSTVGILVQSVTADSAADRAGVLAGDYILAAGDVKVESSQDLLRARRQYYAGQEMPLTLCRDGQVMVVMLELDQTVAD